MRPAEGADPEAAPDPAEAPVPVEAVDSAGSGSPEADEAPAPVSASDEAPEPGEPQHPDAPAGGEESETPEGSGNPAKPDDELSELELELKPHDDSVPYSTPYTASLGAEQQGEAPKRAPAAPAERPDAPQQVEAPGQSEEPEPTGSADSADAPGSPAEPARPAEALDSDAAPEPAEATELRESPALPGAESHEADEPPARASDSAEDSAPEPTAPTDAPEPLAREAVPERAEATKPPTDALESADEAPEPTAPIDVREPHAEGARNLAAYVENEAGPVEGLAATTPGKEAEVADPGAADGETLLPGDGDSVRQAHEPKGDAAEGDAAEDEAERYGNSALRDGPSYQQEIDDQLGARSLDRSEHDKLRLTRTNELSEAQAREVVGVRDAIKLDEGRMVTKVIDPKVAEAYLENATELGKYAFNPGEFRGSIARGCDTADLRSMDQLRDGLALDDGGAGWTPVPPGAPEAYQLRFQAPHDMRADPTLGAVGDQELANHIAGMADQSPGRAWDDPFLGTGYTGGGVPEWCAEPTVLPHHAEIWRMHADGTEEAVGFFNKNEGLWNLL
ncbi:hypothetical protein ACFWBC_09505 [Streptomyces sp. NPDC059985]|uniref:hypothetical protein n=1 Tax=Streptomyces sp. NPDC059985 TaxID=3347025 RepID=UPI003689FE82